VGTPKKLGIIVGGGPAPGINAVIGAATIHAANNGMDVIGFYDGFKHLSSESFDITRHATPLRIPDVARIHFTGGSILRTSRASLIDKELLKTDPRAQPNKKLVGRVAENLRTLGVDALLTIGGDDTALSARFISDATNNAVRMVHVPKTIDNDLPLPADIPTFGFSTARFIGTELVKNLMRDSQTTGRWYIVEAMGRTAGWLAMSIGMSAGATLSLIPEEFDNRTRLQTVLDVIEGCIIKRRMQGRPDGVIVLAEGLAYKLGDKEELEQLLGREVPLDAAGHPRLAEVDLADLIAKNIERRFHERGDSVTIVDLKIGYELRCADPTPFDMGYCRSLGYGSIQLLLDPNCPSGVMVAFVNGNLQTISLQDMVDPATNRTRTRVVDPKSDSYRVARAFQIRLNANDLANPETLAKLAGQAKMTPESFRERFQAATKLANGNAPSINA
jgi:6-phosphofructokinase 1